MNGHKLAVAALLLTLLAPTLAQEQEVTPTVIQDTWMGKTLAGKTTSGEPVTLTLQADGTASLSAGSTNDTGTWRLSEQGYCTTWKDIRSGRERCFTVRRVGTTTKVFNPDGSVNGEFTEIR